MGNSVRSERLRIGGMTCASCRDKIEKKLRSTAGVKRVQVDYGKGSAEIAYDTDIISRQEVTRVVEKLGYSVLPADVNPWAGVARAAGFLAVIVGLYLSLEHFGLLNLLVPGQLANAQMGYAALFVTGLLTSVHCIAMCGGISLSQCLPKSAQPAEGEKSGALASFAPAFLYNAGRVISYTLTGFILGLAGSVLGGGASGAGLPLLAQGILKLIAGAFMVIMGVNMLGLFPALRKLQPRMPKVFAQRINADKARAKSPLVVGLLNGLMPCGPLQSMQIVALASGSPVAGALSMLMFSLGTVPLMLGLGSIVALLGRKFTAQVMKAGAVLVVVLGLSMLSQGGSLSGMLSPEALLALVLGLAALGLVSRIPFKKPALKTASLLAMTASALAVVLLFGMGSARGSAAPPPAESAVKEAAPTPKPAEITLVDGKQVINSTLNARRYPSITVQAGVPVKWVINAPEGSINGCNYAFNIPEYGIEGFALEPGENVIEFTPTKAGKFLYSCWMGMMRATITVVEGEAPAAEAAEAPAALETPAAEAPAAYPELDAGFAPSGGCCG